MEISAKISDQTNFVGLFDSVAALQAEYPSPKDGLFANVTSADGSPDDRFKSQSNSWVGMGSVSGDVFVNDNKSLGVITGDGLKYEDDNGSAKISLSGVQPVIEFDVTADSSRTVSPSLVGELITIVQTPPSISIPMMIDLEPHANFALGDTIKISADRDGVNKYENYYFAVNYTDASGRNLVRYPANNLVMIRTEQGWIDSMDGRFTNVSIRPKTQFNIPYVADEQYNTPVNAFVFAESDAVEFNVDESTNTRIVKIDLDSVSPDLSDLKNKISYNNQLQNVSTNGTGIFAEYLGLGSSSAEHTHTFDETGVFWISNLQSSTRNKIVNVISSNGAEVTGVSVPFNRVVKFTYNSEIEEIISEAGYADVGIAPEPVESVYDGEGFGVPGKTLVEDGTVVQTQITGNYRNNSDKAGNLTINVRTDDGVKNWRFYYNIPKGSISARKVYVKVDEKAGTNKTINSGETWQCEIKAGQFFDEFFWSKVMDSATTFIADEAGVLIEENNDEIITPNQGTQFQLIDTDKASGYGDNGTITYYGPNYSTGQAGVLINNLANSKSYFVHKETSSQYGFAMLHESYVSQIYNQDVTGVSELTMLLGPKSRGRYAKYNQVTPAGMVLNWNGEYLPDTEDPNAVNPANWIDLDGNVTTEWSKTGIKTACYSIGLLANDGSALLQRGDVFCHDNDGVKTSTFTADSNSEFL